MACSQSSRRSTRSRQTAKRPGQRTSSEEGHREGQRSLRQGWWSLSLSASAGAERRLGKKRQEEKAQRRSAQESDEVRKLPSERALVQGLQESKSRQVTVETHGLRVQPGTAIHLLHFCHGRRPEHREDPTGFWGAAAMHDRDLLKHGGWRSSG